MLPVVTALSVFWPNQAPPSPHTRLEVSCAIGTGSGPKTFFRGRVFLWTTLTHRRPPSLLAFPFVRCTLTFQGGPSIHDISDPPAFHSDHSVCHFTLQGGVIPTLSFQPQAPLPFGLFILSFQYQGGVLSLPFNHMWDFMESY